MHVNEWFALLSRHVSPATVTLVTSLTSSLTPVAVTATTSPITSSHSFPSSPSSVLATATSLHRTTHPRHPALTDNSKSRSVHHCGKECRGENSDHWSYQTYRLAQRENRLFLSSLLDFSTLTRTQPVKWCCSQWAGSFYIS